MLPNGVVHTLSTSGTSVVHNGTVCGANLGYISVSEFSTLVVAYSFGDRV